MTGFPFANFYGKRKKNKQTNQGRRKFHDEFSTTDP